MVEKKSRGKKKMAEGEKNPKLDLKNLHLGDSVKLKLDCAKAVKTGETQYGTWHMWFAFVDGTMPVVDENKKVVNGYKGKVIFFPSKNLNKDLEKAANGNTEVEVKITKNAKEGQKGLLTVYTVEKLSDGKPVASSSSSIASLTEIEQDFVNAMNDLVRQGYKVSKELVIKGANDPNYQISETRALELINLINAK